MSEEDYLSRRQLDGGTTAAEDDRLDELRDEDPGETWQTIREFQFEEFERLKGVAAQMEADSYDEAVQFAGTVLDEQAAVERPSFLEDPAAFDHMMQYMDEESGVQMVWQALERDPDEDMEALLDEKYSTYVETAMERELMNG